MTTHDSSRITHAGSSVTSAAANPVTRPGRILLGDGFEVSAQGYGAMSVAPVYGPVDDAEALATLHHAVDIGVTFIDTANIYGMGHSEKVIAKLNAGRRDEIELATKFGIIQGDGVGKRGIRGDRAHVHEQIDASLARLGTDHVDLYYQHRVDPNIPIEETVGAMAELVAAGKVLHLGLSEATGDELRRANAVHPIAAIQSEWSILSRDVENRVAPTAAELGVGFVPFSPVGRGFLTGVFDASAIVDGDVRTAFPRFTPDALKANSPLRDILLTVAAEAEATPAQVALAWLYAKANDLGLASSPIPGTRFADRVSENAGALQVSLSEDQIATLDTLAARVSGQRAADLSWVSAGRE